MHYKGRKPLTFFLLFNQKKKKKNCSMKQTRTFIFKWCKNKNFVIYMYTCKLFLNWP